MVLKNHIPMKNKILTEDFFIKPTLTVAKNLLGTILVYDRGSFCITEVEAYDGFEDKASHASRGRTKRNAPMFGPPGFFYVYLVYGMHWMLNVVTGPKEYPAAILIRGVEDLHGPARLTKTLGIDGRWNAKKAHPTEGLWFEDHGMTVSAEMILQTPRIGVDYAGPIWSQKPYRFLLKNDDAKNVYRQSIRSGTQDSKRPDPHIQTSGIVGR